VAAFSLISVSRLKRKKNGYGKPVGGGKEDDAG
jgi:hypothetical protein